MVGQTFGQRGEREAHLALDRTLSRANRNRRQLSVCWPKMKRNAGPLTSANVASDRAGSRQRLQHRLQLLRQQPLALRLQVLEFGIPPDGRFHGARTARLLARCVLQHAGETVAA